jgi:transcriptional regulator NrdR family protein
MKQYKERHVYFGVCDNCTHKYCSFKRTRIKNGLCRKCRKTKVNKDQIGLFPSHTNGCISTVFN